MGYAESRAGANVEAYQPRREAAQIEPVFADDGSARATKFRVCVPCRGGEFTHEFDFRYFAARAGRQRAVLRRDRELPAQLALAEARRSGASRRGDR